MKRLLVSGFLIAFGLAGFSQAVSAQSSDDFYTRPKLTALGDWLTNVGPRVAKVAKHHAQAGALWRVVSPQLNCRKEASLTAPILLIFRRGTVLQADLGRGGADEVLYNALDSRSKPWMRVRNREGLDLNCYVRANQLFIHPLN